LTLFFVTTPVIALAGQYQMFRVVDGDTIVIRYNGKLEKIRLLCVNTPESVHTDRKQYIPMGQSGIQIYPKETYR
jgi:micrococcal nuclease